MIVQHLRRPDHCNPLAVDRAPERAVRLRVVETDADHGKAVSLGCGERVAEARFPKVEAVVVRHGHDVHRPSAQRCERVRRCSKYERLTGRRAAVRHGGLEVHDREVGLSEERLDRVEDSGRIRRELRLEDAFEVDVAAEGQHHRLSCWLQRRACIPRWFSTAFTSAVDRRSGEHARRH